MMTKVNSDNAQESEKGSAIMKEEIKGGSEENVGRKCEDKQEGKWGKFYDKGRCAEFGRWSEVGKIYFRAEVTCIEERGKWRGQIRESVDEFRGRPEQRSRSQLAVKSVFKCSMEESSR